MKVLQSWTFLGKDVQGRSCGSPQALDIAETRIACDTSLEIWQHISFYLPAIIWKRADGSSAVHRFPMLVRYSIVCCSRQRTISSQYDKTNCVSHHSKTRDARKPECREPNETSEEGQWKLSSGSILPLNTQYEYAVYARIIGMSTAAPTRANAKLLSGAAASAMVRLGGTI